MNNMSKDKPSTSMNQIAYLSKLCSVVMSSMYPYRGNWVAMGHALCIMPRLPTHLVQELNDGTAYIVKQYNGPEDN